MEKYLTSFISKGMRSLISQLRCGILPLEIETGRFKSKYNDNTKKWCKIPENERLCKICNTGSVENKYHFIRECPEYTVIRDKMFEEICQNHNNFIMMSDYEKYIHIMKNEYKSLGTYLQTAWYARQMLLSLVNPLRVGRGIYNY